MYILQMGTPDSSAYRKIGGRKKKKNLKRTVQPVSVLSAVLKSH